MAMSAETIDQNTLKRLVEAGAVRGADIIGHQGGWGVVVKYGMTERALAARRGSIRSFRKLETIVTFLKKIGISQCQINSANFDPVQMKRNHVRPDAANRMKEVFEAKAYNDWLNKKLEAAESDTRPLVSHDEVMRKAQAIIEAARKHHAA